MAELDEMAELRAELQKLTTMGERTKQMILAMKYAARKRESALVTILKGPKTYSPRITATAHWGACGREDEEQPLLLDNRKSGFVDYARLLPSLSLYHRKKFLDRTQYEGLDRPTLEDESLFNLESNPTYENIHPGTITVEGLGMEAWSYEEDFGSKRLNQYSRESYFLPRISNVPLRALLHRFHELQHPDYTFGSDPIGGEADLCGLIQVMPGDLEMQIYFLCTLLDKGESGFVDFRQSPTIIYQWVAGGGIGLYGFLRQVILARELVLRLQKYPDIAKHQKYFTAKVQASIIIQDLFFRNIRISLGDARPLNNVPASLEHQTQAEALKLQGNEAFGKQDYQRAADLYTKAIDIDPSSAVYRSNRSAAYTHLGKYEDAADDASTSIGLDPHYAKAWVRLGAALLKLGLGKRSRDAYHRAIDLAGKDATALMKQGLAAANAKVKADLDAIYRGHDRIVDFHRWKAFLVEDWALYGKSLFVKSTVRDEQVTALMDFAVKMKWPYVDEVSDTLQRVFDQIHEDKLSDDYTVNRPGRKCVIDWYNGVLLPGKWMSFTLMTTLVYCTPSLSIFPPGRYYNCGLTLPTQSYWRSPTVLGGVLGCLPDVNSLCGWIGPCPPVKFGPPHPTEDFEQKQPHYVALQADRIPPAHLPDDPDRLFLGSSHQEYIEAYAKGDEDFPACLAEMQDPKKWVTPECPQPLKTIPSLQSIKLTACPLPPNVDQKNTAKAEMETLYEASMVFKVANERWLTFTLKTDPVFVTLPRCNLGHNNNNGGQHQLHMREFLKKTQFSSEEPEVQVYGDSDYAVAIINARGGYGAEVMARAWCSWVSKNALIARKNGGPCFSCAVRATRKPPIGLGVNALILAD